jgi:hypothetical protein
VSTRPSEGRFTKVNGERSLREATANRSHGQERMVRPHIREHGARTQEIEHTLQAPRKLLCHGVSAGISQSDPQLPALIAPSAPNGKGNLWCEDAGAEHSLWRAAR